MSGPLVAVASPHVRSSVPMRFPPYAPPLLLSLAWMVAAAPHASAQAVGREAARDSAPRTSPPDSAAPQATCFRARPASACRGFLVLEAGVYPHLAGTAAARPWGARQQLSGHGSWELGYMANTGARSAIGGAVVVGVGGGGSRWGAKARYRRWLPAEFAADVGAGLLSAEIAVPVTDAEARAPVTFARGAGVSADVGLSWRGTLGVGVRADAVHARGSTAGAVYAGVQLGSGAAVAGTVAAVLAVGAMFAALAFGGV